MTSIMMAYPIPVLVVAALLSLLFGCAGDAQEQARSHNPLPDGISRVADTLRPVIVTDAVYYDSDDPAVWVHPDDPAQSLVLGTDKHPERGGVYAFDLEGRIIGSRTVTPLQRMNNVDVLYGFALGGERVDIAVATERRRGAMRVFALPEMTAIDGGGIPVFEGEDEQQPMGITLYKRPRDGSAFAIVSRKTGPRDGYLWQYQLEDDGTGQVRAVKVREVGKFSGTKEIEAIAVDDDLGYMYYSDEQVGIRKYQADPEAENEELTFFGRTGFVRDHEGIAIFKRGDGTGYILVSDQDGQRIQVFPREGSKDDPHHHPPLAVIPIKARETDGIEVVAASVGPRFPRGMLVAMSTDRTFHYYSWEDVEAAIQSQLEVESATRASEDST